MRKCGVCEKVIISGIYNDQCLGVKHDYYCSDDCLETEITKEFAKELYQNEAIYWTDWEVDDCVECEKEFSTTELIPHEDEYYCKDCLPK